MATAKKRSTSIRLSITLPKQQHKEIDLLSKRKRVSLAWVIRDAVDQYLRSAGPVVSESIP